MDSNKSFSQRSGSSIKTSSIKNTQVSWLISVPTLRAISLSASIHFIRTKVNGEIKATIYLGSVNVH